MNMFEERLRDGAANRMAVALLKVENNGSTE
jgi:hypothetical protein